MLGFGIEKGIDVEIAELWELERGTQALTSHRILDR